MEEKGNLSIESLAAWLDHLVCVCDSPIPSPLEKMPCHREKVGRDFFKNELQAESLSVESGPPHPSLCQLHRPAVKRKRGG